MSADNWTTCPKCKWNEEKKKEKDIKKLNKYYGKIPASEFAEKYKKINEPILIDCTLREDYEIGISDGLFEGEYRASCSECKFSFEWKDSKIVFP